ncbi:MAG TPA: elongation factor G [Thermoanaerobaculia bacterium]|nr:elongation factor G [Thermoanaerobaculia bacterium]
MQVDAPDKIRNLALCGHNDTGKTTLTSALLYTAGAATRMGRVEDKSAVTDFDPEEQARGISIGLGIASLLWRGHKVNLIDCPGYGIFFTETKAGLRAADAALLCTSAVAGVEVTTEKAFEFAAEIGLPVIVTLTKMDRERADFERALASLQKHFGRGMVAVQYPLGREHGFSGVVDLVRGKAHLYDRDGTGKAKEVGLPTEAAEEAAAWRSRLVEAVAETDDALMEKFFEHGELSEEELVDGLRRAVRERKLFPVTAGSGGHAIATASLLDFLIAAAPSPVDRAAIPVSDVGGSPVELACDPAGPAAALVFKTLADPFTGKLSILRVVSGTLTGESALWNMRTEEAEKLGHVANLQGKTVSNTAKLMAGDIGGVPKLKAARSGDTLCAKERPVQLAWFQPPEPAISYAIEPKSKGDDEKIGDALQRLMEEDLALRYGRDPQTYEFLVSGTGQLHVEITVAKLRSRFHVEVILHPPKVPYRETILKPAEGHGRHKKQTGGRGQFADCRIKIEPLPRGGDFEFVDEIFGGSIPHNYRPAVEKGIREARGRGYLAGYPVVDFRVRLVDGQYHEVDSSELAFKIAGSLAFKEAMSAARPTILEPMMKVEIEASDEFMGDIMSDLSQRRGRPQGMEVKNGGQVVSAVVPMAEMLNYAPALRAMTQGRAGFHMEFSHYEEVPRPVQEKIIAEAAKRKQAEKEE